MPSPQNYRSTTGTHRIGTRAAQPAANTVLIGTLYFVTDESVIERSDGSNWITFSTAGSSIVTPFLLMGA